MTKAIYLNREDYYALMRKIQNAVPELSGGITFMCSVCGRLEVIPNVGPLGLRSEDDIKYILEHEHRPPIRIRATKYKVKLSTIKLPNGEIGTEVGFANGMKVYRDPQGRDWYNGKLFSEAPIPSKTEDIEKRLPSKNKKKSNK